MFEPERRLIDTSLAVIEASQTREGAFLACPAYPTYRYSWFRDGAFVAEAMDLWDRPDSAAAFHAWVIRTLRGRFALTEPPVPGEAPLPDRILHTRYRPDGTPGGEDWPNFQLDGFGTWLWSYGRHVRRTGTRPDFDARNVVARLVRYLTALWDQPNYDCWEEHPDRVHPSTLGAIAAGLDAAADILDDGAPAEVATRVRAHLLEHGVRDGAFTKHVGSDAVDANLLWLAVPYAVVPAGDPRARCTAQRVREELTDPEGGVKRYLRDTFYGGGSWLLLTAAASRDALARGDRDAAERGLRWIEAQADDQGRMPEQVSRHLLTPARLQEWVDLWGPVATPLTWSHAAYLTAVRDLREAV